MGGGSGPVPGRLAAVNSFVYPLYASNDSCLASEENAGAQASWSGAPGDGDSGAAAAAAATTGVAGGRGGAAPGADHHDGVTLHPTARGIQRVAVLLNQQVPLFVSMARLNSLERGTRRLSGCSE